MIDVFLLTRVLYKTRELKTITENQCTKLVGGQYLDNHQGEHFSEGSFVFQKTPVDYQPLGLAGRGWGVDKASLETKGVDLARS